MPKLMQLTTGYQALVDNDWHEMLSVVSWKGCKKKGASRGVRKNGKSTTETMHRIIMDASPGEVVDHINGNPLDNRRENLRTCSQRQNCMNRHGGFGESRYKGVHLQRSNNKWVAQIRWNRKKIHLGSFDTEEEAAEAYNTAAKEHFDKFACLNEIKEKNFAE